MKRALPVLFGLVALLAYPSPVVVADGAGESLLERLSAETSALTAKADAQSGVLSHEEQRLAGVLVGEPARFVVALDDVPEHGSPPKAGKLTLPDGTEVDATLLDADAELGLAVYALTGAPRAGLTPAGAGAIKRGTLAVTGGGSDPGLVMLGEVGGPLEDVVVETGGGTALLAPGGRLLGLATWPAAFRSLDGISCATCHNTGNASPALRLAAARTLGTDAWRQAPGTAKEVDLAALVSRARTGYLQSWIHDPHEYRSATPGAAQSPSVVVPATVIERALADLAQDGRLRRPYLGVVTEERAQPTVHGGYFVGANGVRFERVAEPLVFRFGGDVDPRSINPDTFRVVGSRLVTATSVRLAAVLPDSPAAKAGLEKGFEIIEIDGRPFAGARGFARALARRRPGEEVRLSVKGRTEPVRVVLADRERDGRDLVTAAAAGLEVQTLTPDLVAFLELPKGIEGVVVRAVVPDSAAAQAGLRRGDVVVDGGNGAVRDAAELDAVLAAGKEAVLLGIQRGGQRLTLNLTLPARGSPRKTR